MKNFYESERKAQANVPSRNVSALYKMANSTNITLKLIPDTYEMIDSIDFSSLLGFVCKKSNFFYPLEAFSATIFNN